MLLTCIIIDEDPLSVDMLEYYISQTEGIRLIAKSAKASDILSTIRKSAPDIVFIDISISGIENLVFDDIFQKDIVYVFVTKYPYDYVLDVLPRQLANVGYLNKPVSFLLFKKEIGRIKDLHASKLN
ncbi:LytR/AlgR family response regulator transcription factor [Chitinophaga silvisoli]|uniref:Response regulator n=1 Tax=Chitinophaga silvisoli TaxID=2291814 RepID=A0A3E1P6Q7_9BACT|nr:response regulator [Chitinophaga silvisoli]RFM35873.1 response regulator [Chitinophaga silvisoli]